MSSLGLSSAGHFTGTGSEYGSRFTNKEKRMLKEMRFSDSFVKKVDMPRVKLDLIKPWITERVTEMLGMEDEVVTEFVINQLEEKEIDPRKMQINLTGFLNGKNARVFMEELWDLLSSASISPTGIPEGFMKRQGERAWLEQQERRQLEERRARVERQLAADQRLCQPSSPSTPPKSPAQQQQALPPPLSPSLSLSLSPGSSLCWSPPGEDSRRRERWSSSLSPLLTPSPPREEPAEAEEPGTPTGPAQRGGLTPEKSTSQLDATTAAEKSEVRTTRWHRTDVTVPAKEESRTLERAEQTDKSVGYIPRSVEPYITRDVCASRTESRGCRSRSRSRDTRRPGRDGRGRQPSPPRGCYRNGRWTEVTNGKRCHRADGGEGSRERRSSPARMTTIKKKKKRCRSPPVPENPRASSAGRSRGRRKNKRKRRSGADTGVGARTGSPETESDLEDKKSKKRKKKHSKKQKRRKGSAAPELCGGCSSGESGASAPDGGRDSRTGLRAGSGAQGGAAGSDRGPANGGGEDGSPSDQQQEAAPLRELLERRLRQRALQSMLRQQEEMVSRLASAPPRAATPRD